jgi:hypothetical protein
MMVLTVEISLDAVPVAGLCDLVQVVDIEVVGTVRPHVELSDAEVYRVGTGLYGGGQRLARPHGGHDFKVLCL